MQGIRVLLGWELGEHRGHVLRMRDIAVRLRAAGAEVAWAAVRLDQLEGVAETGEAVFQSPLWPGHDGERMRERTSPHRSHADILADLGLGQPGAFHHLQRGWEAILAAARPDAVFADYAPGLITACRGRVPTVAAGIGFTLPPAHLDRFPLYAPASDAEEDAEPALLEAANAGLRRLGRDPLPALPALYAADAVVVSAFRELDPYAEHRLTRPAPPSLMNWAPPAVSAGEEIVVYWAARLLHCDGFFDALARIGAPVRVVVPGLRPEAAGRYAAQTNIRFTDQPLAFREIAAMARVVISNGNTGFVSAAMLAGLPQAVLSHDLQKSLVGRAVERLGVGVAGALATTDWLAWASRLQNLLDDEPIRARSRALSRRLIPRMHVDPAELCATALAGFAAKPQTPSRTPRPLVAALG